MIERKTAQLVVPPQESKKSKRLRPSSPTEAEVWRPMAQGWQPLYGNFHQLGVSVEWHDFESVHPFEWSRSFHSDSLELCLNLSGQGSVRCDEGILHFAPLTAGFYLPGPAELGAWRCSGQRHRFITVEFSRRFLRGLLAGSDGALHPLVETFLQSDLSGAGLGELHRLGTELEQLALHLVRPPAFQAARNLWYQSKVLQLIAEFFFERRGDDEMFCDRQKRTARERVERVVAFLKQRLSDPPSLEEIGRAAGCSPFYLSRTFTQEMGMTISQFLRKIRMERAAELLRSGRYNVTEAALAVGYSSLSHFSHAFCQTMGCCPNLYPDQRY
ncbi:MAG: AraC family transcriptional regulator [Verrucomicrobiales bacterium]|nr:AraC family transcriptional regulator [Verrucomicrobiales bacterium]